MALSSFPSDIEAKASLRVAFSPNGLMALASTSAAEGGDSRNGESRAGHEDSGSTLQAGVPKRAFFAFWGGGAACGGS